MSIKLYTTHCPKCKILEKKLKDKNINYEEITDTEIMLNKGFITVPMLEVDGVVMDYARAFNYIENVMIGEN